jgi:hypothetical protein
LARINDAGSTDGDLPSQPKAGPDHRARPLFYTPVWKNL